MTVVRASGSLTIRTVEWDMIRHLISLLAEIHKKLHIVCHELNRVRHHREMSMSNSERDRPNLTRVGQWKNSIQRGVSPSEGTCKIRRD